MSDSSFDITRCLSNHLNNEEKEKSVNAPCHQQQEEWSHCWDHLDFVGHHLWNNEEFDNSNFVSIWEWFDKNLNEGRDMFNKLVSFAVDNKVISLFWKISQV